MQMRQKMHYEKWCGREEESEGGEGLAVLGWVCGCQTKTSGG